MSFLQTIKNALHDERGQRGRRGYNVVPTRALIELVEHFERVESQQRLAHNRKHVPEPARILAESLIASYHTLKDEGALFLFIMDVLKPLIEERKKMERAKAYTDGYTNRKRLLKKIPDGRWIMCGLCDTAYDPNGEDAKNHEHPEPQSGEPRDAWIKSGMKYNEWITETHEGLKWASRHSIKNDGSKFGNPKFGA